MQPLPPVGEMAAPSPMGLEARGAMRGVECTSLVVGDVSFSHHDIYEPRASAQERFKTTVRAHLLQYIFKYYPTRQNVHSPWFADAGHTQRLLCRSPLNNRQHDMVEEDSACCTVLIRCLLT